MQYELNVAGGSLEAVSNLDRRETINYLNTPSKSNNRGRYQELKC